MTKRAVVTASFEVPTDAIEQASLLAKLQAPKNEFERHIKEAVGEHVTVTVTSKVFSPVEAGSRKPRSKKNAGAATQQTATAHTGAASQANKTSQKAA